MARGINRNLAAIGGRTVHTMGQSMALSDLYRLYTIASAQGHQFRYSTVAEDFVWTSDDIFDGDEMRRLYQIGLKLGKSGKAWNSLPPGVLPQNIDAKTD